MPDEEIVASIKVRLEQEGIDKAVTQIDELKKSAQSYQDTLNGTDDQRPAYLNYATDTFASLSKTMTEFASLIKQTGVDISSSMLRPFEAAKSIMTDMQKAMGGKKFNASSFFENEKTFSNILHLSEFSSVLGRINGLLSTGKSFESKFGWSASQFNQVMPLLMNRTIQNKVNEIKTNMRDAGDLDVNDYVSQLMNSKAITDVLKNQTISQANSRGMTKSQMRENLRLALMLNSSTARERFGRVALARAPIENGTPIISSPLTIPAQFRSAYLGRGYASEEESKAFLSSLTREKANQSVNHNVYRRLREYVNNDEDGVVLNQALRDAGIMRIVNGESHWAKRLTVQQASLFAGLAARELYDAKRGYTFYDADPNDPGNNYRVDRRLNRRVRGASSILSILSGDENIRPELSLRNSDGKWKYEDAVVDANTDYLKGHRRDQIRRISNTPAITQFVAPNTYADEKGNLVFRDPKWQKKTRFAEGEYIEPDHMIGMTDNSIYELLSHIKWKSPTTNRTFKAEGPGTFGWGRYENNVLDSNGNVKFKRGEAIYDTPPIISVDAMDYFTEDKNGKTIINPDKEKAFRQLLSGSRNYGGRSYSYLNQSEGQIYMIEDSAKKAIQEWTESQGIPDFFEGGNPFGLSSLAKDPKDLIKQINSMRKSTSSASTYESLYGKLPEMSTRVANLTAFFNALRKSGFSAYGNINDKEEKAGTVPDGVALGNSEFFRNGPMQMRSALGYGKYVLNPYNFKEMFGSVFSNIDQSKVTDNSYNNNWLISKGSQKDQFDYWLPGINATVEDVMTLMSGTNSGLSEDELRKLREARFFKATEENLGMVMTDKTSKQNDQFKHLTLSQYAQFKGYGKDNAARKRALDELSKRDFVTVDDKGKKVAHSAYDAATGLVELTPEEQGLLHDKMTPDLMVMRNEYDFANEKGIMSQQMAAALGISVEDISKSDAEFERRIYELQTSRGRMKALQASPAYAERIKEKGFVYSNEAEKYIQSQIRQLKRAQLEGYIALPEGTRKVTKLAAATPGAFLQPFMEAAGINVNNISDEALRSLLPFMLDKNEQIITSPEDLENADRAVVSRDPAAVAEMIFATNAFGFLSGISDKGLESIISNSPDAIKRLRSKQAGYSEGSEEWDRYQQKITKAVTLQKQAAAYQKFKSLTGVTSEQLRGASWLTTQQMYEQNTGDFDGDVINMYTGLSDKTVKRAEEYKAKVDAAGIKFEEETGKFMKATGEELVVNDQIDAEMQAMLLTIRSTQAMGAASKLLREAGALDDNDPRKWSLLYEGKKAYDFASSDMRKKAGLFNFTNDAESLMKKQNLHQRFIKSLNAFSDVDLSALSTEDRETITSNTISALFKSGLPSITDAQGFIARSMTLDKFAHGEVEMSFLQSDVDRLLNEQYGMSDTPEANAAKHWSNLIIKNLSGQLISERDIEKANEIQQAWDISINQRGNEVSDRERTEYGRFTRNTKTLRDNAPTRENIENRLAQLKVRRASNSGYIEKGIDDEISVLENALMEDEAIEGIMKGINIADWKETEEYKQQQKERLEAQTKLIEEQLGKGKISQPWEKIKNKNMNWSSFQNWIKGDQEYRVMSFDENGSSVAPVNISFDNAKYRENTALQEMLGKSEQTAAMGIGTLMHQAFEDYFNARMDGTLNGRTIDDMFENLIGNGDTKFVKDIPGISIIPGKTKEGKTVYNVSSPYHNDDNVGKLNNILPVPKNEVSGLRKSLAALEAAGFDLDNPDNIEGDILTYNKGTKKWEATGTRYDKFDLKVRDFNADGSVKKDDKGNDVYRTVQTYARPDLMLHHKGGKFQGHEYDEGYYVIDYKSGFEGAKHSLKQSAFYAALYNRAAEGYYNAIDKQNAGEELTAEEAIALEEGRKYARYGEMATDSSGHRYYRSKIKGAIGLNPNGSSVLFDAHTSSDFATQWNSALSEAQQAIEGKSLEAILAGTGMSDNAYDKALASMIRAERAHTETQKTTQRFDEDYNAGMRMDENKMNYFLARYTKDLDEMNRIGSLIRKESDEPPTKYNRFALYRDQLSSVLPDEVYQAAINRYEPGSPEALQIQSEMERKRRYLSQIEALNFDAAVGDWTKLSDRVESTIGGAKVSSTSSSLQSINNSFLDAQQTRKGLFERTVAVDKKDENGKIIGSEAKSIIKGPLSDYMTNEQKADLFDIENENEEIRKDAKESRDQFLASIEAEKKTAETIKKHLPTLFNADKTQDAQEWANITGEIQDPSTVLEQSFEAKKAEITKRILSWNKSVAEMQKDIDDNNATPALVPFYKELINEYSNRAQREQSYLDSKGYKEKIVNDEMQRLGLSGAENAQDRAAKWADERQAAIDKALEVNSEEFARISRETRNPSNENEREARFAKLREINERAQGLYRQRAQNREQRTAFEQTWQEEQDDRLTNFDNMINRKRLSDEDRIETNVKQARRQALYNSIDPKKTKQEREEWYKRYKDEDYWKSYRGNLQQETNNDNQLRDLRRINSEEQNLADIQMREKQTQWARDDFYRNLQNRNGLGYTMFGRNYLTYQNRRIQLERDNTRRTSQNESIDRQVKDLDQQIKNAKAQGKTEDAKDLETKKANLLANKQSNLDEIKRTQQELNGLSGAGNAVNATFDTIGQTITRFTQRIGRQMFQKALQETKRFIKEFDSSMNEIQAITLKGDQAMASVRSNTINKALNLRTSVSNVASTEAALYRQGLSDSEVSQRTDAIVKFATVAKLKTTEATKIITTALQNNLVTSAEQAMDALVALGDSAATTAAEIGKGMQKAAASAKVAGVSYAELTSLLTFGTSDTQLSGSQVGTALQTVFTRMRRLTADNWVADQNGEKTTANDAEKALNTIGVSLWSDKANGQMRGAYDILIDIAKVWNSISDAQKSIVTSALAGTRQTNIFSTLMEGLGEDGGKRAEEYLGLAESSQGITQTKYEIAMESLNASLETVKSSWDAIVESFTNSGTITGVLDGVSGFMQMIANLASTGPGQFTTVFAAIAGGIAAVAAASALLTTSNPVLKTLSTLLTVVAGVGTFGILTSIAGLFAGEDINTQKEKSLTKMHEEAVKREGKRAERTKAISDVEELGAAYDELAEAENSAALSTASNNLKSALLNLADVFPNLTAQIMDSTSSLKDWRDIVDKAKKENEDITAGEMDVIIAKSREHNDKFDDYMGNIEDPSSIESDSVRALYTILHAANASGLVSNKDVEDGISAYELYTLGNKTMNGYFKDYTDKVGGINFTDDFSSDNEAYIDKPQTDFLKELIESDNPHINRSLRKYYDENKKAFGWVDNNGEEIYTYDDFISALKGNETDNVYHMANAAGTARGWISEDATSHYGSNFLAGMSLNPMRAEVIQSIFDGFDNNRTISVAKGVLKGGVIDQAKEYLDAFETNGLMTLLSEATGGEYSADFIKEVMERQIYDILFDENGEMKKGVTIENVNTGLNNFLDGYMTAKDKRKYLQEYIDQYASPDMYEYFLPDENGGIEYKGYTTIEAATKAAKEKGIGTENIMVSDGKGWYRAYYSTPEEVMTARVMAGKSGGIGYNEKRDFLKDMNKFDNIGALKKEYSGDKSETFGSLLSGDVSTAAYYMAENGLISYNKFKDIYGRNVNGQNTDFDLIEPFLNENGTIKNIDLLRTDEFKGARQAFENVFGSTTFAEMLDKTDEITRAEFDKIKEKGLWTGDFESLMTDYMPEKDDTVSVATRFLQKELRELIANAVGAYEFDEDLARTVKQAQASKEIERKFQFDENYDTIKNYGLAFGYGTETQKNASRAQVRSTTTNLGNFNAAVDRYTNGKARDEDYRVIAGVTGMSESYLRNNANSKTTKNVVGARRDLDIQSQIDLYGKVREASGIKENSKQDKELLNLFGLERDKDGIIRFVAQEDVVSNNVTRQNQINNYDRASLRDAFGYAITDEGKIYGSDKLVQRALAGNEEAYGRLTQDELYQAYANAGIEGNDFRNMIGRRAKGVTGTYAQNWSPVMAKLMGSSNVDEWDWKKIRENYQNGTSETKAAYEALFGATTNGQQALDYLTGASNNMPSASFAAGVKTQMSGVEGVNYSEQFTSSDISRLSGRLLTDGRSWNDLKAANLFSDEEWAAIEQGNADLVSYLKLEDKTTPYAKRLRESAQLKMLEGKRYDSSSDAAAYARALFNYQNKPALAAQTAYDNRKNYSDISEFIKAQESLNGWTDLVATQEYQDWYKEYVEGGKSYDEAIEAFSDLTMYNRGANYKTSAETADIVERALQSTDRRNNTAEYKAIQSVLGNKAAADWLNGEDLTNNATYQNMINNYRYGLSGYTGAQIRQGQRNIARMTQEQLGKRLLSEEYRTEASQYMSGFSEWNEYAALLQAKASGEKYDEAELDRLQTKFDRFNEQAQIQFEVDGISDLEQAGEVVSGLSDTISKIKQGGNIAIKASVEFENNEHQTLQYGAMLDSASRSDQYTAVKALTGWSDARIQSDWAGAMSAARAIHGVNVSQYGNSDEEIVAELNRRYAKNPEDALELANLLGFELTTDNEGNISHLSFKRIGNGSIDRENRFHETTRQYTAQEINDARRRMLNGENLSQEDNDLYNAASDNAGKYLTAYLKMMNNPSAYTDQEIAEARRRAEQELNLEGKDARRKPLEDYALYEENEAKVKMATDIYDAYSNVDQTKRRSMMSTISGEFEGIQNAQWALNQGATTSTSRNYIASVLGLSEKDVQKAMRTDEGKKQLQEDLQSKSKDLFKSVLDGYGKAFKIEFDTSDTGVENAVSQILENASTLGTEVTNYLLHLAGLMTSDGLLGENDDYDFVTAMMNASDNYAETKTSERGYLWLSEHPEEARELLSNPTILPEGYTYVEGKGIYDSTGLLGYDTNSDLYQRYQAQRQISQSSGVNWTKFTEQEPIITAAILNHGEGGVGDELYDAIMTAGVTGVKGSDYYGAIGSNYLGRFAGINGGITGINSMEDAEEFMGLVQKWQTDETGNGAIFDEWYNSVEGMSDLMGAIDSKNFDKVGEAIGKINDQVSDRKAAEITKYGNASDKALKKIGGYYNKMNSLSYKNEKLNGIIGKASAGKGGASLSSKELEVLSEATNMSTDALKATGANAIKSLAEGAKDAIDTEWGQEIAEPLINSINEGIQHLNLNDNEKLQLTRAIDLSVDANTGQVDISALADAVATFDSSLAETLRAYDGHGGTLMAEWKEGQSSLGYILKYLGSGTGTTGGKGGGGGGGGGGKSEVDKLLEKQKHAVTEAEHNVKMTQIEGEHYQKTGDYAAYLKMLDQEIAAQEKLGQVYQKNIKEMKAQRDQVAYGSDDWYKLTESIFSTEEALAQLKLTINEINGKRIDALINRQEVSLSPYQHAGKLMSTAANKALTLKNYSDYYYLGKRQNTNDQMTINANNKSIDQLKEELKKEKYMSENWIKVRQQIWSLQEENAELELSIVERTNEMNHQRVAQIAEELERNRLADPTHGMNMENAAAQYYQRNRLYDEYRGSLTTSNTFAQSQVSEYRKAIAALKVRMNGFEPDSDAWYEARDMVYKYEEAIASLTNTIDENKHAIQESYITELDEEFQRGDSIYSLEKSMLQAMETKYDKDNDFVNYLNIIGIEANQAKDRMNELSDQLVQWEDLLASGLIDEGSAEWDELIQKIMSVREEMINVGVEYDDFVRKLQQSRFAHDKEVFGREDEYNQHRIKLIQYEESRYQNLGELTNYGTMLEYDNVEQQRRAESIAKYIEVLKQDLAETEEGTDVYHEITSEIMKMEENLATVNNTIEKNNKLLEQNRLNILKVHKALDDVINTEIKRRVQEQRDMLNAEVTLQDSIVDQIRKRYQDEWALVKKDIEEKKKALSEEKNLLNERLNARKNAVDQESKYEKLAELQKQLALIETDPTKTKEAKLIGKQIKDLRQEISLSIADQEVLAESERIDQQTQALTDYATDYETKLNEALADANNKLIADELDQVMSGNFESYIEWMKTYNKAYQNATEEARKQMELGWRDTWNKMIAYIDTYWDEVEAIHNMTEDEYVNWLKQGTNYKFASDTEKQIMEYEWRERYQNEIAAHRTGASFEDYHSITEKLNELQDYTYSVDFSEATMSFINGLFDYTLFNHPHGSYWDTGVSDEVLGADYYGRMSDLHKTETKPTNTGGSSSTTPTSGGGSGSSSSTSVQRYTIALENGRYVVKLYEGGQYTSYTDAKNQADLLNRMLNQSGTPAADSGITTPYSGFTIGEPQKFASGGLVDYTGPAWVDGTPTRPEAFLDPEDTELIRAMVDSLSYVHLKTPTIMPDTSDYGNNNTIGDINITINQAELSSDADIDQLARRVGSAFTRELSHQGLNLANYSF